MFQQGKGTEAFTAISGAIISGKAPPGFNDPKVAKPVWKKVVANAEKYNEPGKFTTFVAYEWTSLPGAANMHRNVIFRDTKVPAIPFTAMDSDKPEDLWSAMETWRGFGATVLAISHNGNASIGKMFALRLRTATSSRPSTPKRLKRNEPLHEAGQTKGDSMAHPMFSPNDEWANFELWNYHLPSGAPVPAMRANYVREGLEDGPGAGDDHRREPVQDGRGRRVGYPQHYQHLRGVQLPGQSCRRWTIRRKSAATACRGRS